MPQPLGAGANFMLLNGMFIDPETNVYDLFAQLRREVSLANCSEVMSYLLL